MMSDGDDSSGSESDIDVGSFVKRQKVCALSRNSRVLAPGVFARNSDPSDSSESDESDVDIELWPAHQAQMQTQVGVHVAAFLQANHREQMARRTYVTAVRGAAKKTPAKALTPSMYPHCAKEASEYCMRPPKCAAGCWKNTAPQDESDVYMKMVRYRELSNKEKRNFARVRIEGGQLSTGLPHRKPLCVKCFCGYHSIPVKTFYKWQTKVQNGYFTRICALKLCESSLAKTHKNKMNTKKKHHQ